MVKTVRKELVARMDYNVLPAGLFITLIFARLRLDDFWAWAKSILVSFLGCSDESGKFIFVQRKKIVQEGGEIKINLHWIVSSG